MSTTQTLVQPSAGYFPTYAPISSAIQLRQEYNTRQEIYQAQPLAVQNFLTEQAKQIAYALVSRAPKVQFMLPEQVETETVQPGKSKLLSISPNLRAYTVGGLFDRLRHRDILIILCQRLSELDLSLDRSIWLGSILIRHASAMYMIHEMLTSGNSVTYRAAEGEEIPSLPIECQFYLPQWVVFDEQDHLLVGSLAEAETALSEMSLYMATLQTAVMLAPYMVVDDEYQQKRYGMLGQLVNQGRALARYKMCKIINSIQQRVAANELNRGLSISLPYFDDQEMGMKTLNFTVIPVGRVMFVSAFMVLAAKKQQVEVIQDTRLSASTRKHLLIELRMLEQAFDEGKK